MDGNARKYALLLGPRLSPAIPTSPRSVRRARARHRHQQPVGTGNGVYTYTRRGFLGRNCAGDGSGDRERPAE